MVLAVVVAIGVLAGPVTAAAPEPPGRSQPRSTDEPRKPALGVQFHGTWSDYTHDERDEVLSLIRRSGSTWVRMDVGWSMIQPEEGEYDLQWAVPLVDEVIEQVRDHGLKLLVMFWQTPGWANDGAGVRAGPSDPAAYARALAWAADRWGDAVGAWEVWNEPNSSSFFEGADPAEYTRLLCPAYRAVHQNDESARVVFGGTMYNDDEWIREAYEAGAKDCFDVMATHPYMGPADAPPETAADGHVWTLRHVTAVRDVMRDHDDLGPVWATEFGWSSHPNTGDEEPWDRGVSRRNQARYAVRTLELLRDEYPYVRKAFWYNERNKRTGSPQQDGYGLLTRSHRPKPVYWALRRYFS